MRKRLADLVSDAMTDNRNLKDGDLPDHVYVPRSLLLTVLDEADSILAAYCGEFCCSDADREVCDAEQARIDQLRLFASRDVENSEER